MRIIVQGEQGEGSKAIATFLHGLLAEWGVPVELKVNMRKVPKSVLKCRVRKIADGLEEPIIVTSEFIPPSEEKRLKWTDHLSVDENEQIIVKGTWVTVGHVVSMIVDGYSWTDILRTHPELCENDIRACLTYSIQENDGDLDPYEHRQEDSGGIGEDNSGPSSQTVGGTDFSNGYVRITGKPHPVGWRNKNISASEQAGT